MMEFGVVFIVSVEKDGTNRGLKWPGKALEGLARQMYAIGGTYRCWNFILTRSHVMEGAIETHFLLIVGARPLVWQRTRLVFTALRALIFIREAALLR